MWYSCLVTIFDAISDFQKSVNDIWMNDENNWIIIPEYGKN